MIARVLERLLAYVGHLRSERRWRMLKGAGMSIGTGVRIPASTFVDTSHCYLISIGDGCTLGEECLLLAHDAQMDEFIDAARLGRIVIHERTHLGHRTVVLPGVEIGPRTVVLPNSVVMKTLPPDTVCAGNPATVVSTLEAYVEDRRVELEALPTLEEADFRARSLTERGRIELREALARGGYVRTPRLSRTGKPAP